jgi:hypothetical protein
MCTLTILPSETGYLAGINRDELRTRPLALPGLVISPGNTRFVAPREPSGGTWIACNDHGDLFALVNWNIAANQTARPNAVSRGTVIPQLVDACDAVRLESHLNELPLKSLRPFRLIALFLAQRQIVEARWNAENLAVLPCAWARGHWFSSSVSDDLAAKERGATCALAASQWPTGRSSLRRLHRSHAPGAGAFSVCVHRPDALTVSYTEISADSATVTMSYLAGSPCQKEDFDSQVTLPRIRLSALAAAAAPVR